MRQELYYLDPNPYGSSSIVLLHGLGADCHSWQLQIPCLIDSSYRPIVLDIPGFGETPAYSGVWTIEKTADYLSRVLQPFAPFHLVGLSLGGTVALQMALQYPELINKLILVSTFAHLRPQKLDDLRYLLKRYILTKSKGRSAQAQLVAKRVFPHPEQEMFRQQAVMNIEHTDESVYQQAMRALAKFNVKSRLNEIQMPTLVVSGDADTTVALSIQKKMAGCIADSMHVTISGGGHAVNIDHAQEFNITLLGYLSK